MGHLVENLHRTHRVITRALWVVRTRGAYFARDGFGAASLRDGFADYSRCLILLLHTHHHGEESLLFPRIRGAIPDDTIASLEQQHAEFVAAIDEARTATDRAEAGEKWTDWLLELLAAVSVIEPLWHHHVDFEERVLTQSAIDSVLSPQEEDDLTRALREHDQRTGHIPELATAFALYNLHVDDRSALERHMPEQITNELLPGAWRVRWAPMQPFLLG